MIRKLKPKILIGAAAGIAVAGGGAALAATQFTSPKEENQAVLSDAAKQLGIQPSELSAALKKALENRVDAAVADGRLTKEQGAELKKRIEAGDLPLLAGPWLGPPGPFGHFGDGFTPFGRFDAAASYLGLTKAQLFQRLNEGKTLADIAKAQGKTVDGLVSALYDAAKKRLDKAVDDGRLTKAEEQSVLDGLEARLKHFVNDGHFLFHRDNGPFRGRGWWPDRPRPGAFPFDPRGV
jgi:polyhydroxyalkanoate synthesis regulator phasin